MVIRLPLLKQSEEEKLKVTFNEKPEEKVVANLRSPFIQFSLQFGTSLFYFSPGAQQGEKKHEEDEIERAFQVMHQTVRAYLDKIQFWRFYFQVLIESFLENQTCQYFRWKKVEIGCLYEPFDSLFSRFRKLDLNQVSEDEDLRCIYQAPHILHGEREKQSYYKVHDNYLSDQ